MLNVDAYANIVTESGQVCINQAGYANFRLLELVAKRGQWFNQPLIVPNSSVRKYKGMLSIACVGTSLKSKPEGSRVASIARVRGSADKAQRLINDYIQINRQFYEQHPPLTESVRQVTVFRYDGRKGRIPGSMFDIFKIPPSYEEYYLNCLRYALQRREPFEPIGDDGDLGKRFLAMSEAERTCVVMDMLCIYANYCVYETDEVDNNEEGVGPYVKKKRELIESFDAVEPRDGGDCEDFAKQMVRQAIELKVNGAKTFVSSAMRLVIEILNRFIFASVLCGVSKGSISFKDLGTAKLSGHECAVAIPKYVFFKALSRSNPNHPLFKLYSEEEINRGKGAEIYVLEGTGNLFPEPRAESRTHEKLADILFDSFDKRATTNACRQFFYKPDADDNFYKELIVIMTPEFFLLKGYVDCEFLLCLKNPDGSGRIYRGVHFSSFLDIDKNTSVQLVETPLIPLKTFRAALRFDDDNFPPMALRPARASQEMLKIAQDLTTVNLKYLGKEPDDFYSFQIRFQEMTPERLAILIREIKGRNLRSICYVEPVKISHSTGEAVGGYCLIVFF
jgi:hypothetical protein